MDNQLELFETGETIEEIEEITTSKSPTYDKECTKVGILIQEPKRMETGINLDGQIVYVPFIDLINYEAKPENKGRDIVEVWREFARNWIASQNAYAKS